MKKIIVMIAINCLVIPVKAQSDEIQQLLLNIQKLSYFKKILQNMYEGYQILNKGYSAVKDISQGNFILHNTFLDALFEVSPAVKKYKRIADIINYQFKIVKEYKAAFNQFKNDQQFTVAELEYIGKVYQNLFQQSLQGLDELAMVITAKKLRMSDDERLQAIDKIYASIEDQYSFLKDFNGNTAILSLQRKSQRADLKMSKSIYGLK